MRTVALSVVSALCIAGCKDGKDAKEKPAPAKEPATAPAPAVDTPAPAVDKPAATEAWSLKLDGKRDLAGPSVMMTKPREVAMYGLSGGGAMTNIHVEDGKSDAYMAQIVLADTGEMCMYRADNKQLSKGLTIKLVDGRYEVEGEITCGQPKDPKAPKTVHKLTGYFEKK